MLHMYYIILPAYLAVILPCVVSSYHVTLYCVLHHPHFTIYACFKITVIQSKLTELKALFTVALLLLFCHIVSCWWEIKQPGCDVI